jgi:hypothetical protein
MTSEDRRTADQAGNTIADEDLRELVSQHAARNLHDVAISDPTQGIVEPQGMSVADEAELEVLLELADPAGTGDEQAAIERLVTALDEGAAPPA